MDTLLTVRAEDLNALSAFEAVDVFRQLLWAEARASALSISAVDIPLAIDSGDGGVDATVRAVPVRNNSGLLSQGENTYQIKTGFFNIRQPAKVKEILTDAPTKRRAKRDLKPRIRKCLDAGGVLFVVLFGWDEPDPQNDPRDEFRTQLAEFDPKYASARIEILKQNHLINLLSTYPSLALQVNRHSRLRGKTHASWATEDTMQRPYHEASEHSQLLADIQEALRAEDHAVHLRVLGEPGIGKTRLIFEATQAPDLAPLVLYYAKPSELQGDGLYTALLHGDNTFEVVLVVDECNAPTSATFWNAFRHLGPRLRLVTINNAPETVSSPTIRIDAPVLPDEQIVAILHDYVPEEVDAERWARFCSGSPRVAHMLGHNLALHPDDLLRPRDTEDIWTRFLAGSDDPEGPVVRERRSILQHLALFERFGYAREVQKEARTIASLIQDAEPNVTWAKFVEVVSTLQQMRILQGDQTLYITPRALHVRLWADWWRHHAPVFDLNAFVTRLESPQLFEWFSSMFRFAHTSELAREQVRLILGPTGPFRQGDLLYTKLGGDFFLALTEGDPEAALHCLERILNDKSVDELRALSASRRSVVGALERLAVWRSTFKGAARILLDLGTAENERWTNNASGVFADLFSLGYGPVAPTETPPIERLPVLREALTSSEADRWNLGLRGLDAALQTGQFSRSVGAEYQGMRTMPKLWTPESWDELFASFRAVWELAQEALQMTEGDQKQKITELLLRHSRGLLAVPSVASEVVAFLDAHARRDGQARQSVEQIVAWARRYDDVAPDVVEPLDALAARLEQQDQSLRASLERWVGTAFPNESFDDEDPIKAAHKRVQTLAQSALQNPAGLNAELAWLTTDAAKNGFEFGHALAEADISFDFLPRILEAQRAHDEDGNAFFLAGYLRGVFERDTSLADGILGDAVDDPSLRWAVFELTWRTGDLTQRRAQRLISLVKKGHAPVESFGLFRYGGGVRPLSRGTLNTIVTMLLAGGTYAALTTAVTLLSIYYVRSNEVTRKLPKILTLRVLKAALIVSPPDDVRDPMADHYWTIVARAFIEQWPESGVSLASFMLNKYVAVDSVGALHRAQITVLNQVAKQVPEDMWLKVRPHLSSQGRPTEFFVKYWLRGNRGAFTGSAPALRFFPPSLLWSWVEENSEQRAPYAASIIPYDLSEESYSFARELLVRYGNRKDVRRALEANAGTESWAGNASAHYAAKHESLLDLARNEKNVHVRRWLEEVAEHVAEDRRLAAQQEERGH